MNRYRFALSLLAAIAMGAPLAQAETPKFQGYFSQGIIYSGDNPFFDNDTGVNFNYRELGLNLSWNANERLRFAGQILSRKAGVLDDGNPKLDFLLADYNFYVSEDISAGVRLGRVKNHYGLYNTTRDVPHGRPGVFVPQSVYFESLRGVLLSSDGGDFYLNYFNDIADISLDLYGGKAHFDNKSIEYQLFQADVPGKFDDVDGTGLKMDIKPKNVQDLTLGFTLLDINTKYRNAPTFTPQQQVTEGLKLLNNPSSYPFYITRLELDAIMQLYSLQYARQNLIYTAEYLDINLKFNNTEILNLPISLPRDKINVAAYYAQVEWIASNKLSVYTRYEELYYDSGDKSGKEYAALTGGNPITQYNKAFTLGARWYFTPDFSITAESSHNKGAAFINGQADVDYSQLKEDWNMFILQLSYHF